MKNEYGNRNPYCEVGRRKFSLERQPSGDWLIVDDTRDNAQQTCG